MFWVLTIVLIVADQVLKAWCRHSLVDGQSVTLIPGVLDLTLTTNRGIAFGMLQGAGPILAPIAIAISIGAAAYSMRHRDESPWMHVAMTLLASGAVGNLYDRVVLRQVTDMFHIRLFEFPIFNLADSCITVAAAILILRWTGEWFTHKPSEDATESHEPPLQDQPSPLG